LILKVERSQWADLFGDKPSFRLSKRVLAMLEEKGAEAISSEEEAAEASLEIASFTGQQKFRWEPDEDEETGDE